MKEAINCLDKADLEGFTLDVNEAQNPLPKGECTPPLEEDEDVSPPLEHQLFKRI